MDTLNILLVDDDRNLVTTLSYGLRKAMGEAISVAVCFSGSEALSLVATQAFDVVVSDFNMPGPSGLEFLAKIRQDYREIILVLITAYGADGLEERVRQLGVGYITKPFEPSFLAELIKGLIQGAETAKTKSKTESAPRIMTSWGNQPDHLRGCAWRGDSMNNLEASIKNPPGQHVALPYDPAMFESYFQIFPYPYSPSSS